VYNFWSKCLFFWSIILKVTVPIRKSVNCWFKSKDCILRNSKYTRASVWHITYFPFSFRILWTTRVYNPLDLVLGKNFYNFFILSLLFSLANSIFVYFYIVGANTVFINGEIHFLENSDIVQILLVDWI